MESRQRMKRDSFETCREKDNVSVPTRPPGPTEIKGTEGKLKLLQQCCTKNLTANIQNTYLPVTKGIVSTR